MSNPISAIGEAEKLLNKVVSVLKLTNDEILQISKNARKASSNFLDIKTPKELNEQLKVSRELQEKLTKAYEDQKSKVSSLQKQINALKKARRDNNKVLTEEEKQQKRLDRSVTRLKQTYSETEKQIIRNNAKAAENRRNIRREETLYGKISIKLKQTAAEYKELSLRKQVFNNVSEKEERRMALLEKRIDKYRGALVKADERTGNFGRNVGNYASGFDGLGNSINQLTREMPAFANSAQTGFMAISNNIPTLVDEINRLRTTNKALAAEGKPTKSILTQLGAAMFSWQTAISIGITLLTVYGKDLVELAFGASEASKQQQRLNEAIAQGNADAVNASANLKTLLSIVKDTTASEKAREGALKSLSETVVELEGVELSQAGAMERIISLSEKYILATEARAKADAFASLSAEVEAEIIKRKAKDLETEAKWYDKLVAGMLDYTSKGLGSGFLISQASKNRAKGLKEEGDFLEEVNGKMREYLEQALELESGLEGFDEKSSTDKRQKEIGVIENLVKEYEKLIDVKRRDVLFNQDSTIEEIEKAVKEIKELQKEIENLGNSSLDGVDLLDSGLDFELPKDKDFEKFYTDAIKNIGIELEKLKQKGSKTFEEIVGEAEYYTGQLNATAQMFFQNSLERYDQEEERNNLFYANVLDNEELTEQQRSQLEAQRDAKNAQIRRRRIEEERRQAKFQKVLSITQIAINTAQAISKSLATNPLPAGAPFVALNAALGLAQTAAVLAQPIPQYATGKSELDNYSGPAWVGDGGRREVIYNPNTGQIGVTPDTPTLTNLKSDDIVYKSIPDAIDNIGNTALLTSMYSQGLNNYQTDRLVDTLLSKYQGQITREFSKGFDKMKKLKINNNIYISRDKWGSNSVNSKYKG